MSLIELKLPGLTPAQAHAVIAAYEQIIAGQLIVAPHPAGVAAAQALVNSGAATPVGDDPFTAPSTNSDPFVPNVPARQPAPAPTPAPVAAAPGTEVDAFGVPYNPALHSVTTGSSKGRNQDGSWKMKKGVKRDEFETWARTHRAAAAAPATPAAPAPTPANLNTQFGAPPVSNGDPFAGPVAPGQAFGSPPPALPEVPYEQFVALCNEMMLAGKLASNVIAGVKAEIGCEDESKINNDPATRARAFAVLSRINTTGA